MNDQITLDHWLGSQSPPVSKQELGRRVGCSGEHIGRICKVVEPPVSQALALRIFDETGVKVGPLRPMTNTDIAVVRRLNAGAAA